MYINTDTPIICVDHYKDRCYHSLLLNHSYSHLGHQWLVDIYLYNGRLCNEQK